MGGQASRGGRSLVVGGGAPGAPACTKSGAVKERDHMEIVHRSFLFVALGVAALASSAAMACPCRYTAAQLQAAQAAATAEGRPLELPRSCACETDGIEYTEADAALSACGVAVGSLQSALGFIERHGNDPSLVRNRQKAREGLTGCLESHRRVASQEQERSNRERAHKAELQRMSALVEAGRDDAAIMQIVDSGNICSTSYDRSGTLKEIADEKLYSKKVGVVNLARLEELKQDLRDADRALAASNADLRRLDRKPLPCTDGKLAELRFCYNDKSPADQTPARCADDNIRVEVSLFGEQP